METHSQLARDALIIQRETVARAAIERISECRGRQIETGLIRGRNVDRRSRQIIYYLMLSRNNNPKVVSSVLIATAFAFDVRGDGVEKARLTSYVIHFNLNVTSSEQDRVSSWLVLGSCDRPNPLVCSRI